MMIEGNDFTFYANGETLAPLGEWYGDVICKHAFVGWVWFFVPSHKGLLVVL